MEYDSWCSSGYEFNRELGAQMGEQSKRLGLQFNFAPVLDINTNPKILLSVSVLWRRQV
jgi:hypothetical protein